VNLKGRCYFKEQILEMKITFTCVSKKEGVRIWTGFKWFRIGTGGRCL
jgi:hypothetical protein